MMKFQQLYSSSKGNLYTLTFPNGSRLLIEAGVSWAKIQKALDYDLSNIVGCLITHEHKDHSRAIKDVMKAGINVYASAGTLEACGVLGNRRAIAVKANESFEISSENINIDELLLVYPYQANHDAKEPLLFIVRHAEDFNEDGEREQELLLFATDTSHITQNFKLEFDIIAIECSYDKDILTERVETEDINESLAKRLLTSHMEKQDTINYLDKFCELRNCKEIHLLHLSGENIDKEKARAEVEKKFWIETKVV